MLFKDMHSKKYVFFDFFFSIEGSGNFRIRYIIEWPKTFYIVFEFFFRDEILEF